MKTARETLAASVEWLLARQSPEGWWSGELETNVTMTAEQVLLFRFLGLPIDRIRSGAIAHILQNQRGDGSWALYYDGPADLSTTIEAYVALKVLGVDPQRDEMREALAVIHRLGGVRNARVFTKIWLAIFGKYPWKGVPSLPPEIVVLPVVDAVQRLRFRVLGSRHRRTADDRRLEETGSRSGRRRGRDRAAGHARATRARARAAAG